MHPVEKYFIMLCKAYVVAYSLYLVFMLAMPNKDHEYRLNFWYAFAFIFGIAVIANE